MIFCLPGVPSRQMIPSGWKSLDVGGMASSRARVPVMNAALGPLDYRVPHGMKVEPGSIVVAPLGPRQLTGIVWEPERLPSDAEVGDNRLRNLVDRKSTRLNSSP